jgi:maltooligosyltrehalose trehalohydrolase
VGGGTHFRVWAPAARTIDLVLERPGAPPDVRPMQREPGDFFEGTFADVVPGDRYRYRLDGGGPFPDPASRCQPDGVHGASMVVDPAAFRWSDEGWRGVGLGDLVLYELHVGTFTEDGTFAGVERQLPYLKALGVTAIELMPVADFPGARGWGYDGAALFAPAHCYGAPDNLRRLVDAAHRVGLAVHLDVVYNHAGPDGAYLFAFSPYYFTSRHQSPWGAGVNLDGERASEVRAFLIENALHWVHEYHIDGLRLDATHAIADDSPRHFLAELASRVKASVETREVLVIAEDHRNLATMVRPPSENGWGLDAVWADDLHHEIRRHVAGDADGYYQDYRGATEDIAATIRQGWFFTGQHSSYLEAPRGTDPVGIPPERFVVCLQNHDQIGNRAFGDRLTSAIDPAVYRAASVLLLTVPETPLMFMGQEWAATSPFLYFTDHHAGLGRDVTAGRRLEFARFAAFSDPAARERIPDPQAESTFLASRLPWSERTSAPHAGVHALYVALLALRRQGPAFRRDRTAAHVAVALDEGTVAVRRSVEDAAAIIVVRLSGAGRVSLDRVLGDGAPGASAWTVALDSEDARFAADPAPPQIDFARPAAVVLTASVPR